MNNQIVNPVRLRPVIGEAVGTTAFFRNRPLINTLLDELEKSDLKTIRVLFHACSIGAEVYSFVIKYLERDLEQKFELQCFAADKQQEFLNFANAGIYPASIADGLNEDEQRYFDIEGDNLRVTSKVKQHITFLQETDFTNFKADNNYEVVFLLNALVYVPPEVQSIVIDQVAGYSSDWFVVTGFHLETIKQDLRRNNYKPYVKGIKAIHNAWLDRITREKISPEALPPYIYTDWSLRPFSKVDDYKYRYCALFRKK